jgi:BirA family transcriptional regulator, biotin operon repressor / biotin---[acetyl-CoA-carboxylase] ligase
VTPPATRSRPTLDGVPAHRLAARWGVPQALLVTQTGSALDVVHKLAAAGAPDRTSVVVEEQTAGRGRDGRAWQSPWGGVWLAMLLRPWPLPDDFRVLAIRAGLVVADVVDELLGSARARIKWPNDVLVADRKVAGILCEARSKGGALEWLGLGVGVNVTNEVPAGLGAALCEFAPGIERLAVLDRLVPALGVIARGGAALDASEHRAFVSRDWLNGRTLLAPVPGRAAGIDPDGALLVVQGAGSVRITDGHVRLADA